MVLQALDDLQRAVGQQILGDMEGRLALRATKLAATTTSALQQQDDAASLARDIERYDITNALPEGGSLRAEILAPRVFENSPELFYGPFMQLGTFMGIQNPVLRFVVDAVVDPINLIAPGSGVLLNRTGQLAKLVTTVSKTGAASGRQVRTVSQALDEVERAVKFVGQGPEFLARVKEAAKVPLGGRAYKALVDEAMNSSKLTDDAREVLGVLRKNRKALVDIAKLADKAPGAVIPDQLRLADTIFGASGRLARGQVNPLFKIDKPFALTRSLLGMKVGDTTLWSPFTSRLLMGDGARAAAGIKSTSLVAKLKPGSSRTLGPNFAVDLDPLERAASGQNTIEEFEFLADVLDFGVKTNTERLSGSGELLDPPDDVVLEAFRLMSGERLNLEKPADLDTFSRFKSNLLDKLSEDQAQDVAGRLKAIDDQYQQLSQSISEGVERRADQLGLKEEAANALLEGRLGVASRVRNMLSAKSILGDPGGLANGVRDSITLTDFYLNSLNGIGRDILEAYFPGVMPKAAGNREFIDESMRFMIEKPEMFFRDSAGHLRLKSADEVDKIRAASAKETPGKGDGFEFWDDLIKRSSESGHDVEGYLRGQGLPEELAQMVERMGATTRFLGQELTDSRAIEGFVRNYFMRLASPTRKFRGARGRQEILRQVDTMLSDETHELHKIIVDSAKEPGQQKALERMQKIRRATERAHLELQKRGLLRMERSTLGTFTEYVSQANKAMVFQRLTDDLLKRSPVVTPEIADAIGGRYWGLAGNVDPKVIKKSVGLPQVVPDRALESDEPWKALGLTKGEFEGFYVPLEGAARTGVLSPRDGMILGALKQSAAKIPEGGFERAAAEELADELSKGTLESRSLRERLFGQSSPVWKKGANKGKRLTRDDMLNLVEAAAKGEGGAFGSIEQGSKIRRKLREAAKERKSRLGEKFGTDVATAERSAKAAARIERGAEKPRHPKIWVMKGLDGPLREAFGLFTKQGLESKKGWQLIDDVNYTMKGMILNLSFFHYNVLAMAGLLANPERALVEVVRNPAAKEFRRQLLVKQGIFGGVGAVAGGVLGEDEEGAIFGGLAGLMYGTAIGAAVANSKLARKWALNPDMMESLAYMGRSGWVGRPNDRAIGLIASSIKGLTDKLRREGGNKLLMHPLDGVRHVQEGFEQNMWEVLHNGYKHYTFHQMFMREKRRLAQAGLLGREVVEGVDSALLRASREILQVVNSTFGGQSMSRMWNDPTWQNGARRILLSPDWTIGNIIGAGNMMLNMSLPQSAAAGAFLGGAAELLDAGFDPDEFSGTGILGGALGLPAIRTMSKRVMARMLTPGDVAARQTRRLYTAAIFGGLVFSNLANKAFTGRWMFENPEGKRLSIALPGDEFYVTLGKPYKETGEFFGAIEREKFSEIFFPRAATKIAPLPRLAAQVVTNTNGFGGPVVKLTDDPFDSLWHRGTHVLESFTPIVAARPLRLAGDVLAGEPSATPQRAVADVLASSGFAVSRDRGVNGAIEATLGSLGLVSPPSVGSASRRGL